MNGNPATRRRRELIATIGLSLLVGGAILFLALLILGQFLLAMLVVIGVMAVVGVLHYFTWGRAHARQTTSPPPHQEGGRGPGRRF
jgi:hypothetical protein